MMDDDCVQHYELEWVQEQIWALENTIRSLENKIDELQMENTLLRNDLNTIKTEGCWKLIENPNHEHKK